MNENFFINSNFEFSFFFFQECGFLNYGYGCNESCQCGSSSTCIANATNLNGSCTFARGYQAPLYDKRLDMCGKNINILSFCCSISFSQKI